MYIAERRLSLQHQLIPVERLHLKTFPYVYSYYYVPVILLKKNNKSKDVTLATFDTKSHFITLQPHPQTQSHNSMGYQLVGLIQS